MSTAIPTTKLVNGLLPVVGQYKRDRNDDFVPAGRYDF